MRKDGTPFNRPFPLLSRGNYRGPGIFFRQSHNEKLTKECVAVTFPIFWFPISFSPDVANYKIGQFCSSSASREVWTLHLSRFGNGAKRTEVAPVTLSFRRPLHCSLRD